MLDLVKQKGLAILSIILILAGAIALASGAYYLGKKSMNTTIPTPAPTLPPINNETTNLLKQEESWQTYENKTLGIAFQYPENWVLNLIDAKDNLELCDVYEIESRLLKEGVIDKRNVDKPGIRFGPCEGTGIKPAVKIIENDFLNLKPSINTRESDYAVKIYYYENPENLTIQEFNEKYLSESWAGDPFNIWGTKSEKIKGPNGTEAYFNKESYCVAVCQIYTFSYKDKIYIMKNFPLEGPAFNLEDPANVKQLKIFQKIFSSYKFLN